MSELHVFDHPLIQHKLSILRDKNTSVKEFRELVGEIAMLMCYEATRDLPLEEVEIETPVAKATVKRLAGKKLAIVPILRAGLGMVDGMVAMIPSCKVGQSRPFAMKYSLLMSIPAVLGANLLSLIKAIKAGVEWSNFPAYLIGMIVSIVVGYFSIILLQRLLKKGKFGNFAYYMWGVGVVTLIASLF